MITLNSPLYVTGDYSIALDFARICAKVVYVGDIGEENDIDIRENGMILGGVLVPPYQLLSMDLDKDPNVTAAYSKWLYESPDVNQYIATIICALYKNANVPVVLYFPDDTFTSFLFPKMIISYLRDMGIQPGIITKQGNTPYQYNINSNFIVEYMYMQNAITPEEYIVFSDGLTQFAADKLRREANLGNITDQDMMVWYSYAKNNLLNNIR